MRVFVALGETALIGAVLYFAAIGYKHLFAMWPWHALFGKRGRASRHPDFRMVA